MMTAEGVVREEWMGEIWSFHSIMGCNSKIGEVKKVIPKELYTKFLVKFLQAHY